MSGWRMVPVEPTREMIAATRRAYDTVSTFKLAVNAAPSPWRPISEAPKDGRPLLLWNPESYESERQPAPIVGFCYDGYGWRNFQRYGCGLPWPPTLFIDLRDLGVPA